jgi:ABC-type sugar transport system ATPase subunit
LGIGRQQLVEIAKALSQDAKILVLDEPTAALTESEVETLFDILTKLKARGVGLIYISHKLEEVFRMSDRITVLRDGKTIGTHLARDLTKDRVIAEMVGREVGDIFPNPEHELGNPCARDPKPVGYSVDRPDKRSSMTFRSRSAKARCSGSPAYGFGQDRTDDGIFGAWQGKYSRTILVDGNDRTISSPSDAIDSGIAFVTEDRNGTD